MSKLTFSLLEKGKTYVIQTDDKNMGGIGRETIGTVLQKEKSKKDQPGSLLIEFQRSPSYFDKRGVEVKQSPKYQVWVMGDYHIASYRELAYSTRDKETEKDLASA